MGVKSELSSPPCDSSTVMLQLLAVRCLTSSHTSWSLVRSIRGDTYQLSVPWPRYFSLLYVIFLLSLKKEY